MYSLKLILSQEFRILNSKPRCWPVNDLVWRSRWENGMYSLKLIFSQDFPDVHPRPRFETKMFHPQVPPSTPPASERRGKVLKGVKDGYVKAKPRVWPCLFYMCHARSKVVQPLLSPSGPSSLPRPSPAFARAWDESFREQIRSREVEPERVSRASAESWRDLP